MAATLLVACLAPSANAACGGLMGTCKVNTDCCSGFTCHPVFGKCEEEMRRAGQARGAANSAGRNVRDM